MLVEEIDAVGSEAAQRPLDARGTCSGRLFSPARAVFDLEPNLVAITTRSLPLKRAGHELLVGERAVDLGRIEEGDAEIDGPVDGGDRVVAIGGRG